MSGRSVAVAAGLGALAVICAAVPLFVYTLTLAVFGLAHVLSELRYVDLRFSRRLGGRVRAGLAVLLAAVVAIRLLGLTGAVERGVATRGELVVVALLAALVVPGLGGWRGWVGGGVVAAVGIGAGVAPVWTFLILAVLHNLTPLGFLAEAAASGERLRVVVTGAVAWVAAPLLLATGLLQGALADLGLYAPDASVLTDGGLSAHLGAYLHPSLHGTGWAAWAFSGAVLAQCLHYVAVLGIMPRMVSGQGSVPWPSARGFAVGVALVSLVLLGGWVADFGSARSAYGVVAAVHAWVEVPLLLVALVPRS